MKGGEKDTPENREIYSLPKGSTRGAKMGGGADKLLRSCDRRLITPIQKLPAPHDFQHRR